MKIRRIFRLRMLIVSTSAMACLLFEGQCMAPRTAMRPVQIKKGWDRKSAKELTTNEEIPKPEISWYIRCDNPDTGRSYSCSFVEFDERGDYLDFFQHVDAMKRISQLSAIRTRPRESNENSDSGQCDDDRPLLLVIYCHGWRNNSESDDVTKFNDFLGDLSAAHPRSKSGGFYRVHGVYLSWRGNSFKPWIDSSPESAYHRTKADFRGDPIVAKDYSRSCYFPTNLIELATFWSRKNLAESTVSGVPIARSILEYAYEAKDFDARCGVIVIGHSFGALMLERALGQATVGTLTWQWNWPDAALHHVDTSNININNPLPFNCVIFVNSAAPSLYAKELSDLLWGYRRSAGDSPGDSPKDSAPVIISITSEKDAATKYASPIGIRINEIIDEIIPFHSTLDRKYEMGVLSKDGTDNEYQAHAAVKQSDFYEKTPGHNRLLVNYWIVPADENERAIAKFPGPGTSVAGQRNERGLFAEVINENLNLKFVNESGLYHFYTSGAKSDQGIETWTILSRKRAQQIVKENDQNQPGWKSANEFIKWSTVDGVQPYTKGNYWIIRSAAPFMNGHNDIWSNRAMELYVALFNLTNVLHNGDPTDAIYQRESVGGAGAPAVEGR
jgi:pimeloyl-ACP methyl ester carboxylesterase